MRSVITLKALTYGPTGGIVAAPTTSLPEQLGGERNWDYRYCWLRDATLTLLGAMHAGYYEEAQAWREWLLRAVAGSPDQLQIMYGIGGERRLTEWVADWLPGYENSAPVRIGNDAHSPASARRVRRGDGHLSSGAARWLALQRGGMGDPARVSQASCEYLARAGPGNLGNARAGPAFHLLEGHGVGGVRSRHQERRGIRAAKARSMNGASCATRFATTFANVASTRSWAPLCRPTDRTCWTRACCSPLRRLPAGVRSADRKHRQGDRARPHSRRLRHALQHREGYGHPAAG